ncbi:glycosyltransferase family 2 protein [Thermodesulfobacteriota bacterium]
MSRPIISSVIPTVNRPDFLPRAVSSALDGMPPKDVEILVIPNGPDSSWKDSLKPFEGNPSLKIIPIADSNANIARNVGLRAATGEFVRFLDDDDFLIKDGAVKQYELIKQGEVDVVSGNIKSVTQDGRTLAIHKQPKTNDFCVAILGPDRLCLPTAHVYKRSLVENLRWNPNTKVRQDFEWLFELCSSHEIKWKTLDETVGTWVQHSSERISKKKSVNDRNKLSVTMLLNAYQRLDQTDRITPERKEAVANGLWGFVHSAFFLEPKHWKSVANTANKMDKQSRPNRNIYSTIPLKYFSPITIMWLTFPKRWLYYFINKRK